MAPFELRHVSIHGHDVRYRLDGHGPVVILVHGIAGSSRTWRAVMPALARDYTVLAPDLLGHGQSAKPIGDYSLGAFASGLRDLLGVLGIERGTVVGHSLGGGVAMQLAYQHPECCERLVLESSGGLGREVSWFLRLLTLPGTEVVMPLVTRGAIRDRGNGVSRFLHARGIRSARLDEIWRGYGSLAESPNRQAFLRTLRAVVDAGGQTVSAMDRLYLAAAIPTMIVWGERDAIIPVAHGRAAHDAIAGSRLEVMEGVGHFPHVEQPDRFVTLLRSFLASTAPGPRGHESFRELLLAHETSA
jgi:pimeloyl-ACP methyl ester carboxylesterase